MLFVNKKYESLDRILESDTVNEATQPNSRGKDLSRFLRAHSTLLKEITDYLCDEIYINGTDYKTDTKTYWKDQKGEIPNKYMIKKNTENKLAKICDVARNVTNGVDDLLTVLNKYTTGNKVKFIPDFQFSKSKTVRRLEFIDDGSVVDYVLFEIGRPTGKDATRSGGSNQAADTEAYIAFAYNKTCGKSDTLKDNDIANAIYSAGIKPYIKNYTKEDFERLDKKEQDKCNSIVNYYEKNFSWLNGVANTIKNYKFKGSNGKGISKVLQLRRLIDAEVSGVSDEWKGKKTPKTDLISNNNAVKLSLKKANTGAQAMSGKYDEAKSTVINVLNHILKDPNYTKNKELKRKLKAAIEAAKDESIEDLESAIYNIKVSSSSDDTDISDEEIQNLVKSTLFRVAGDIEDNRGAWRTKSMSTSYLKSIVNKEVGLSAYEIGNIAHQKLSKILFGILEADDDFKKALVREALTGEIKFSNAPIAIANYVLSWEEGKSNCAIESIYDYIDAKAKYVASTINFKTSGGKGSSSMRLFLPKTTVENEIQRVAAAAAEKAKKKLIDAITSSKLEHALY